MTISTAEPITAADKAWDAKMARLAARKPLQRVVTMVDEDLVNAEKEAEIELGRAEIRARAAADAKHADVKDEVEKRTLVAKSIERDREVVARRKDHEAAIVARDDAEIKLTMRGLGAHVYEAMQADYPASKDQREKGQAYNIDRFAPALVSACCTDPMTPKQAASLMGGEYEVLDEDGAGTGDWVKVAASLNFGEASLLFTTAVGVNEGSKARLGKE